MSTGADEPSTSGAGEVSRDAWRVDAAESATGVIGVSGASLLEPGTWTASMDPDDALVVCPSRPVQVRPANSVIATSSIKYSPKDNALRVVGGAQIRPQ